jgi:catechol 2,3-dioxygenase-like lactoylglutathione lyase family enzyme
MTLRLDHVVLGVHDSQGLAAAYAPAGLELGRDGETLALVSGRGRIVLERSPPPAPNLLPANDAGIAHFCIQSVEPEQLWRDLADRGMRWNAELVGLGTGYLYAYGYDVEGNLVELEGTTGAQDGRLSWLAHVAVVTSDMDRASGFYEALTGAEAHGSGLHSHPNMGRIAALESVTARAAWIATPQLTLELWQYVTPPTGPHPSTRPTGYRSLGFVADDLAAERARLLAAGIRVEAEPDALTGVDPDGNRFTIRAAGTGATPR